MPKNTFLKKDRKAFAIKLKTIYQVADEEYIRKALDCVTAKFQDKYPGFPKHRYGNWDVIFNYQLKSGRLFTPQMPLKVLMRFTANLIDKEAYFQETRLY